MRHLLPSTRHLDLSVAQKPGGIKGLMSPWDIYADENSYARCGVLLALSTLLRIHQFLAVLHSDRPLGTASSIYCTGR